MLFMRALGFSSHVHDLEETLRTQTGSVGQITFHVFIGDQNGLIVNNPINWTAISYFHTIDYDFTFRMHRMQKQPLLVIWHNVQWALERSAQNKHIMRPSFCISNTTPRSWVWFPGNEWVKKKKMWRKLLWIIVLKAKYINIKYVRCQILVGLTNFWTIMGWILLNIDFCMMLWANHCYCI